MKTIIASLIVLASTSVFSKTTTVDVEYKVETVSASCRKVEKGTKSFFTIRLDEASFNKKKASGFKSIRYAKHPSVICENGELPAEGSGTAEIKVLFYNINLNSLNELIF